MAECFVGKKAPDFTMEAAQGNGEDVGKVSLEDYKGKWLVLFFYPADFTRVCPTEIIAFSDTYEQFAECNTEILGVSTDSVYTHRAWMRTSREQNGIGKLNYPLASDLTHKVACDYGVLIKERGVAQRGLFIIDPEGTVQYQMITESRVGRSVDETLRVLQALQAGGMCPANWKPGMQTL
jgi:peroxiredoxin (alkyl hydroperoxide reductase subunit C)